MTYLRSSLRNFKNEKDIIEEKLRNMIDNNNYEIDECLNLLDKYININLNNNSKTRNINYNKNFNIECLFRNIIENNYVTFC